MPRMTAKGQVTIPKDIRQLLGVSAGEQVEFRVTESRQVVVARSAEPALRECAACGRPLASRQHIASDFLIGAHAQVLADRLATRDRGFYGSYFAGLPLMVPG